MVQDPMSLVQETKQILCHVWRRLPSPLQWPNSAKVILASLGYKISLKWVEKDPLNLLQQVFECFYNVLIQSSLFLIVLEMLKICLYMVFLEPFRGYHLIFYYVLYCGIPILEDNIQTEIQQMLYVSPLF